MLLHRPRCAVPSGEVSLRDVLINSRREDGQSSPIGLDKPQQESPGRRPIRMRPKTRGAAGMWTSADTPTKTSTADLSRYSRVQAKGPTEFGQGAVRHCIAKFTRPRRLHQMLHVCLDDAHVLNLLFGGRGPIWRPRILPGARHQRSDLSCAHDGIEQERWRNQRHCQWFFIQTCGGQESRSPVWCRPHPKTWEKPLGHVPLKD